VNLKVAKKGGKKKKGGFLGALGSFRIKRKRLPLNPNRRKKKGGNEPQAQEKEEMFSRVRGRRKLSVYNNTRKT